jgi:hypothetical protein
MSQTVVTAAPPGNQMAGTDRCARFRMVKRECGHLGTDSSPHGRGMGSISENPDVVPMEPISPELALVDPELGARARATLADAARPQWAPRPVAAPAAAPRREHRPYPFWARVTAALWLLVLGMLIGGAAIPHAQDTPRLVPQGEDARFCRAPAETPTEPTPPRGQP